jgi:hypothetical protein
MPNSTAVSSTKSNSEWRGMNSPPFHCSRCKTTLTWWCDLQSDLDSVKWHFAYPDRGRGCLWGINGRQTSRLKLRPMSNGLTKDGVHLPRVCLVQQVGQVDLVMQPVRLKV